jgi:hypothetical protein
MGCFALIKVRSLNCFVYGFQVYIQSISNKNQNITSDLAQEDRTLCQLTIKIQ